MEYFNSLPDEVQEQAIKAKMEELYDNWHDSYISESGDDLPNYVEEVLIRCLDDSEKHEQLAKTFYGEEANA
jgi:hypothetical protein